MDDKLKDSLKSLNDILNSATDSVKIVSSEINNRITPEIIGQMTPNQKKIIGLSNSILDSDISNPEELLKKQQELKEMMNVESRNYESK